MAAIGSTGLDLVGGVVAPGRDIPREVFSRLCRTFPKTLVYELKVKQLIKEYMPIINQLNSDAVVSIMKELRSLIQREEWPHVMNMFKGVFVLLVKERNPHLMLNSVRELLARFPDMYNLHEAEHNALLEYRNMVVAAKRLFDVKGKKSEFFDLVGRMFGEIHSLHIVPTAAILRRMFIFERETGIQCRPKKPDEMVKLSKFEERLLEAKKRRREEDEAAKEAARVAKQRMHSMSLHQGPFAHSGASYSQQNGFDAQGGNGTIPSLFPRMTPQQEAAEGSALLNQAISHVMQGYLPLTIGRAPLHANNGAHEVNSALLMAVTHLARAYSGRSNIAAPLSEHRQEYGAPQVPPVDPYYQVRQQSQFRAQPRAEPIPQDHQGGWQVQAQGLDVHERAQNMAYPQASSPRMTSLPDSDRAPRRSPEQAQADTVRFLHNSVESFVLEKQNMAGPVPAAHSSHHPSPPFAGQPHNAVQAPNGQMHDPWAALRGHYEGTHVQTVGYEHDRRAPAMVKQEEPPLMYHQHQQHFHHLHQPRHGEYEESAQSHPPMEYPSKAAFPAPQPGAPTEAREPETETASAAAAAELSDSPSSVKSEPERELAVQSEPNPRAGAHLTSPFHQQAMPQAYSQTPTQPQPQDEHQGQPQDPRQLQRSAHHGRVPGQDGVHDAHHQQQQYQNPHPNQHHQHEKWAATVAELSREMYEPPAPQHRSVHQDKWQVPGPREDAAYGRGYGTEHEHDPYAHFAPHQHAHAYTHAHPQGSHPGHPLQAHLHAQFGTHPSRQPPQGMQGSQHPHGQGYQQGQMHVQGQMQAQGQRHPQASPQAHPALASVIYGAQDPYEGFANNYGYSGPSDRSVAPGMGAYSAQFRAQNVHNFQVQRGDGYHLRTGPDASTHAEQFAQYHYGSQQF